MESLAKFMQRHAAISVGTACVGVVYGSKEFEKILADQIGAVVEDEDIDCQFSPQVSHAVGVVCAALPASSISSLEDDDVRLPVVRDYSAWTSAFPDVKEKADVVPGACPPAFVSVDGDDIIAGPPGREHVPVEEVCDSFNFTTEVIYYVQEHLDEFVRAVTFYAGDWGKGLVYLDCDTKELERGLKRVLEPFHWFVWKSKSCAKVIPVHHLYKDHRNFVEAGVFFSADSVDPDYVVVRDKPGGLWFNHGPDIVCRRQTGVYHWDAFSSTKSDYVARHFPSAAALGPVIKTVSCHFMVSRHAMGIVPRLVRQKFIVAETPRIDGVEIRPGRHPGTPLHWVPVQQGDDMCAWVVREYGWLGEAILSFGGHAYKISAKLTECRNTPYSGGGFGIAINRGQRIAHPWFTVVNGKITDKLRLVTTDHCKLDKYGCFGYDDNRTSGRTLDIALPAGRSYFPGATWKGAKIPCGFGIPLSNVNPVPAGCFGCSICCDQYPDCYDRELLDYFGALFDLLGAI